MSKASPNIHLAKPEHWDDWYLALRLRARAYGVLELIERRESSVPPHPPNEINHQNIKQEADTKKQANENEAPLSRDQQKALRHLWLWILETISREVMWLIDGQTTVVEVVEVLKRRLAPTSGVVTAQISKEFEKLTEVPKRCAILPWLDRWQCMYAKAESIRHFYVQSPHALNLFVWALEHLNPKVAALYGEQTAGEKNWNDRFYRVLKSFREMTEAMHARPR